MIQIFKGFKSTLPRPAPQDLPIFAGRGGTGQDLLFFGAGGTGQPFFLGAGRTSLSYTHQPKLHSIGFALSHVLSHVLLQQSIPFAEGVALLAGKRFLAGV